MGTQLRDGFATDRTMPDKLQADGVFVFDANLRHLLADDGAPREVGTFDAPVEGPTLGEALRAEGRDRLEPHYRAALAGLRSKVDLTHEGRTFSVTVGPVHDPRDDVVVAGVAYWRDVSDERAMSARREAEQRFRTAFEHAPIGMAIVGLDGRCIEVNPALCDITGYSATELRQRTYQDLTHPDDVKAHRAEVRRLLTGELPSIQVENRYLDPSGNPVWVLVSASVVCDEDGRPLHVIVQVLDIDERKRREQRLQWQAERDSLTGLWNRHRFDEELARRKSLAERHGEVTAVILLDLDDFKAINDTHGHHAGDEVLRRVARVLRTSVRTPDIASRYGGDEFAVVLPHTTCERATRLAERLLERLAHQVIVVDGHRISVSASAGAADDAAGVDPVTAADRALYAAKRTRGVR